MTTWITSDTHLNHKNVIKYCNRPFNSVEEMNEGLVENWNAVVGPKDFVWHLGDVMWADFDLDRLNGIKHLIIGNHDYPSKLQKYFKSMQHYHELRGIIPGKWPLMLMHYPIESWKGKFHGSIHLHGHSHGTMNNTGYLRFDMGVDCWDMKPVSIESVLALVPQRQEEAIVRIQKERDDNFKKLNETAYRYADAMLVERERSITDES